MRLEEFFASVPDLFRRANAKSWEAYEETLFSMHRPLTWGDYNRVKRFVGAGTPSGTALRDTRVHHELDRILSRARYPRASRVTHLEDHADASTEFATAILHFNNPAYPIFDAASVRGLIHLGFPVSFSPRIGEVTAGAYQEYLDVIQKLKDKIPYRNVPERNYYLGRIVQLALWEIGIQAPPSVRVAPAKTAARRPAKPRKKD